ncbi:MAG: Surfeit locus protein 1 [Marteilia pararefringens]
MVVLKLPRSPLRHLFLIIPVTSVFLARWQYRRYFWKQGLKEEQMAIKQREAVGFEDIKNLENYDKVRIRGKFDLENIFFIGPRTVQPSKTRGSIQSVNGFEIIVPFESESTRRRVLVNCGSSMSRNLQLISDKIHEFSAIAVTQSEPSLHNPMGQSKDPNTYFTRNNIILAEKCRTEPVCLYPDDLRAFKYLIQASPLPTLHDHHLEYLGFWLTCFVASLITYYKKLYR